MSRYIGADKLKSETVNKNSIWDKITDSKGLGLSEIIEKPDSRYQGAEERRALRCIKHLSGARSYAA